MKVIGFSGGLDGCGLPTIARGLSPLFFHDAAAALVSDGELTFAVEEERLNRQKHTNAFPAQALRACLKETSHSVEHIDHFAFFFDEAFFNRSLADACRALGTDPPLDDVRTLLTRRLSSALNFDCEPARLKFVEHHRAHARSAFVGSGFDQALVMVIDGNGEDSSTSIFRAGDQGLIELASFPVSKSLGYFYRSATKILGFKDFDEYKFMGLAPYGNPEVYRDEVRALLHPAAHGDYHADTAGLDALGDRLGLRDAALAADRTAAADFAAAVQRALETTALHIIQPWVEETGLRYLCLAGGVAQNCVMNSSLAQSGLFGRVFAYPCAYDAGAAIGAAYETAQTRPHPRNTGAVFSPFLGPACTSEQEIRDALDCWPQVLSFEQVADPAKAGADALAGGKIIGWVTGRSEFGPRALGARSILADPRPLENWPRINLAIKQRESFRPFAPACLEHYARDYFVSPSAALNLGHMTFISSVREDSRDELGAVTHVDGSSRLQTVSPDWNAPFAKLIEAFHALTGCPILLNTSFNNSAEPIVQTSADAVRTFLLTSLDVLVVEDYVVWKRTAPFEHLSEFTVRLNDWSWIEAADNGAVARRAPQYEVPLPDALSELTAALNSQSWYRLQPLFKRSATAALLKQTVIELWRNALIDVRHGP